MKAARWKLRKRDVRPQEARLNQQYRNLPNSLKTIRNCGSEHRQLSVLYLDPDKISKELSPSDESIRTEYEDRLSLIVPERRRLEQILFEEEIQQRKPMLRKKGNNLQRSLGIG